jgi:hypothetical protein
VNTGLLEGHLARRQDWCQDEGGHTDAPNSQHFLPWANRLLNTANPKPK